MELERAYIKRALGFFLASIVIGFAYSLVFPSDATNFFSTMSSGMMDEFDISQSWEKMAWDIFLNNIVIMYGIACLGLLHWILPVGILVLNGLVVGVVISVAYPVLGALAILVALLPHGLFELWGFVLATSIGLSVDKKAFYLIKDRNWAELRSTCNGLLWLLTRKVAPLIIIAALIEGFLIGVLV